MGADLRRWRRRVRWDKTCWLIGCEWDDDFDALDLIIRLGPLRIELERRTDRGLELEASWLEMDKHIRQGRV